jgi:hypothetical protein
MIKLKLLMHTTYSAKTPTRHFFRRLISTTSGSYGEFRYSCKVQLTCATPVDQQPKHSGQGERAGNADKYSRMDRRSIGGRIIRYVTALDGYQVRRNYILQICETPSAVKIDQHELIVT